MFRMFLFLPSIALLGVAVEADTRKILGEKKAIEIDFELPEVVSLFDKHLPPLEDQFLAAPLGVEADPAGFELPEVTVPFDLRLPPLKDRIRVTPWTVKAGPTDSGERFFRLERLQDGAVIDSRTIACGIASAAEKCVKSTPAGDELIVSSHSNEVTCGCRPQNTSPGAKPFPAKLVVDWATGPLASDLDAVHLSRLNGAKLGPRFVIGTRATSIPDELTEYSCALAYLRFVQEQRKADSILLGIIQGTDLLGKPSLVAGCQGDRGRAASIGAICTFCSVAVIQEPCLAVSYNLEHEVAHLLGAHDTNAISHSVHTGSCRVKPDLMKKKVQSCNNSCDPSKIVFCDQTIKELANGPPLMNTTTCEGLF